MLLPAGLSYYTAYENIQEKRTKEELAKFRISSNKELEAIQKELTDSKNVNAEEKAKFAAYVTRVWDCSFTTRGLEEIK